MMPLPDSLLSASSGVLFRQLEKRLREERLPLEVRLWNGKVISPAVTARVQVSLRRPRALWALARPTLDNLAQSYVEQDIDFTGEIRSIIELGDSLCRHGSGTNGWISRFMKWRRHTPSADKKAIAQHYDVSNAFYELWLDSGMVYSCAYFRNEDDALDQAQRQKVDHICRKLDLQPGERFLDIGCGWGALIIRAAQHYGVHAVGITLSQNQYDHLSAKIKDLGLQDRCEVRLTDYRDVEEGEAYDKIASVGMFEHVGVANFPVYFGKIYRLLKPGGLLMNHGITSMGINQREVSPDSDEFIGKYVFPGGELAHVARVVEAMAEAGLECWDIECLRRHYAKTLWHWVGRLEAHRGEAVALVGEKTFRIWQIYMAGSAWAFERGWVSIYQLTAARAGADGSARYPLTRDRIYAER